MAKKKDTITVYGNLPPAAHEKVRRIAFDERITIATYVTGCVTEDLERRAKRAKASRKRNRPANSTEQENAA